MEERCREWLCIRESLKLMGKYENLLRNPTLMFRKGTCAPLLLFRKGTCAPAVGAQVR
jgi:hypothetical protein